MIRKEGRRIVSINYIFCSDEDLRKLNKEYLNHNYYTDILTFNLSTKSDSLIAEIFISVSRVKDNSVTLKQPFKSELHRVMIHGVLHLCGYMDKTKSQSIDMRKAENKWLSLYQKRFM